MEKETKHIIIQIHLLALFIQTMLVFIGDYTRNKSLIIVAGIFVIWEILVLFYYSKK